MCVVCMCVCVCVCGGGGGGGGCNCRFPTTDQFVSGLLSVISAVSESPN